MRFAFARPEDTSGYAPLFGERIVFGHARNELELDEATLALAQRTADPLLRAAIEARSRVVPLLLAFLAGAPLLGWQLARRASAGVWLPRLLIAPLFTLPIGVLAVQLASAPRGAVVLIILAEICAGLALLGVMRIRHPAA